MAMGMNRDGLMHDDMRSVGDSGIRNYSHLKAPSSVVNYGGSNYGDSSFEGAESEGMRQHLEMLSKRSVENNSTGGQPPVFMKFDERKWAGTFVKVYRHMKLMEKAKYLEPHFSSLVTPIAQYLVHKFKFAPGVSSFLSSHSSH